MSNDSSKDVWSKQFYKALEAVGNLTEVEKLRLANMLIALSGSHNMTSVDVNEIFSFKNKQQQEIPPPPKPPETTKIACDGLFPKKPVYPEKVEIKS